MGAVIRFLFLNKMSGFTFNMKNQIKSYTLIILLMFIIINDAVDCRTIDINSYKDIMMPEAIVECRAACLEKFNNDMNNGVTLPNCQDINDCAMCWDFCEFLFVEERHIFKLMCTNHTCVSF